LTLPVFPVIFPLKAGICSGRQATTKSITLIHEIGRWQIMTRVKKSVNRQLMVAKAKEYIESHWAETLSLEQIADQVLASPFHFQKIFKSETGESPKEYLTRIKLENAVQRIRIDQHLTVFDVALECGFSSQASFARAFRQKFGVSATEFRNLSLSEAARLAKWEPSIQRAFQSQVLRQMRPKEMERFHKSVIIKRMEPLTVLYLPTTMVSEQHIGEEFQRLAQRAEAHDIETDTSLCFGAMYDFPLHTPIEKCRYRVCIGIAREPSERTGISSMTIPGGKFGVFPVKGDFETALRHEIAFFSDWLPRSQFQRSEHYFIERFSALPGPRTYTRLTRDIVVPLKPA
jgi:AraC family transcriptional regulator